MPKNLDDLGLKSVANSYDVFFIDIWGVLHNGINLYQNSVNVLNELEKSNKTYILLTNAPRPNSTVIEFLKKMGLDENKCSKVYTSGESALKHLEKNYKEKKFYHIGPPRDFDLFKLFEKNKINNIKFHGNTDKIEEILCSTDIFLLPSKKESFGLAALEAMASKCALVTSNCGGLPELNIDNQTGYLVDVNNENKYIEKITDLISDKSKLEKFKLSSFKRAKLFDIDTVVPIYENIYRGLLK